MSHALPRPPPCLFSSGSGYSRGMCVYVGIGAMCGNLVFPIGLFCRAAGANALWSEPICADIYLQNGKAWSKFLGTLAANVYVYIGILLLHGSSSRRYSYKLRLPKGLANECQMCLRCRCVPDVSHRRARGWGVCHEYPE